MKMKNLINIIALIILGTLVSCSEPATLTQQTLPSTYKAVDIATFEQKTCAGMKFEKPPVDILYIIDNSGSTLSSKFQSIKSEIQKTISTISSEFDYHIYFAPLHSVGNESLQSYPLILSNPASMPSLASVNVTSPSNLQMFSQPGGNNVEHGFTRALNIVNGNTANGIFRKNANTIIVMISNGDDTEAQIRIGGNQVFDESKFTSIKNNFLKLTKKYASATPVANALNSENLRFISLVPHSSCSSGWTQANNYKRMSKEVYEYQSHTDDNTNKDSRDLCSGNYAQMFSAVNSSIRQTVIGYTYDHWVISKSQASSIQTDDITVTRVKSDGTLQIIPADSVNGFEYLGYKSNLNTRVLPSVGEPQTGLMVKLNGSARIVHPDCLIAKTRTPTEYFGYLALPREPDVSTIKIEIDGKDYPQSSTNGWGYIGHRDTQNIKVPGPTNASVTPEVTKSGYIIKLFGDAIFTNGQTINIYYKPKSI